MIGKGRNWARITYLVLFIIGVPLIVFAMLQPLLVILVIGQIVVQIIGLVFLFQKSSSDWFNLMKAK